MAEMSCQSSRPGRFISGEGAASTHRIRRLGTLNGGFGKVKNLLQPGMEPVPNNELESIPCTTQCKHTVSRTKRMVTALRMDGYGPLSLQFRSRAQ